MSKREEPKPPIVARWRVIQQWRNAGTWHAHQCDYEDQREAWNGYLAAQEASAQLGPGAQVDLYDLARSEVLVLDTKTGAHLIGANKVLTKAELKLRLRALFGKSA